MSVILDFISKYDILLIVFVILILLSIIGYYADKTNFGQGDLLDKESDKYNRKKLDLSNKTLGDVLGYKVPEKKSNNYNSLGNIQTNINVSPSTNLELDQNQLGSVENANNYDLNNNYNLSLNNSMVDNNSNSNSNVAVNAVSDDSSNFIFNNNSNMKKILELENELDALLPKKQVIDDDILSDLDEMNLNLNSNSRISSKSSFDSITLPKIKKMHDAKEDIWDF